MLTLIRTIRARFSMTGGAAGCSPLQIQLVASTVVTLSFEEGKRVLAALRCLSDVDLSAAGGFLQTWSSMAGAARCAVLTYVLASLHPLGAFATTCSMEGRVLQEWCGGGELNSHSRPRAPFQTRSPAGAPHADAFPDDVGEEQLRGSIHGPVPVHFGSRW